MVWYEDFNLVAGLIVNIILLIVGLWRRGLAYPTGGLVLTVVMYNYYNQAGQNYWMLFLGFIIGHLIALVRAIKENL